jgi:hypothetical protein
MGRGNQDLQNEEVTLSWLVARDASPASIHRYLMFGIEDIAAEAVAEFVGVFALCEAEDGHVHVVVTI